MFKLSKGPIVLLTCFVIALLWGGCSSGDVKETGTKTPRVRLDDRVKSLLVQGQKAFQRGEFKRALTFLNSAEKLEPEAPVIYYNRGRVYATVNQLDAARKAYREVIALDPEYPEAHLRMGNIEFRLGNFTKALHLYHEEEEIAPSSHLYVKMGEAYAKLGKADSARWAYENAVSLDSTNANAHMMYGQFLEAMGDLEAALVHSREALSLQPDRPNYQFAVGSQLYQLGRLEEAVEYLKRAADARLLHYPAQYNLGQVLMRLGREEEARHYLARADSSRQLMDQIIAAQGVVYRNPNAAKNWIKLGELFRRAGERDKAIRAFNKAINLQPRNLTVQNHIAEMMLAAGNTKEAIQRFQAIVDADKTRVEAWINLGFAYAVSGNCEEARRSWKTALELRPNNATVTRYLSGLCQYTAQ